VSLAAGAMADEADGAETVVDLTNAHLSSLADIGLPSHLQVPSRQGPACNAGDDSDGAPVIADAHLTQLSKSAPGRCPGA
jgi:hypothetical protein